MSNTEEEVITNFVNGLETADIITKVRRGPYVSHPFVVPKPDGSPRFIVDYAHFRGAYQKVPMYLPSFAAVIKQANLIDMWMVKIDLRDAFYAVPLPTQLKQLTAFR